MASISSLSGGTSSSNVSSLYNSANTITGLASGLDTEGMIESLVESYQTKIQSLNNKITKTEWKQEAYRSIISKMYSFSNKYMSYTSNTNLLSSSFFSSATKVTASKDYVTASGKTNSDIALNSVSQLASAAKYTTKIGTDLYSGDSKTVVGGSISDILGGSTDVGKLDGSLTFTYGSQTVSISFDDMTDTFNGENSAQALADAINEKLADKTITLASGTSVAANERIKVEVDGDEIKFTDNSSAGNAVYISSASSSIKEVLGLDLSNASTNKDTNTISTSGVTLVEPKNNLDLLKENSLSVTLNGTRKTISLSEYDNIQDEDDLIDALNTELSAAFSNNAVTAKNENGNLVFEVKNSSDELSISSSVNSVLGLDTSTNYLTTSETLSTLLGDKLDLLTTNGDGKYEFTINGTTIGAYSADTKLSEIISDINAKSSDIGVKVSYSSLSKNFVFTATETGADSKITLGDGTGNDLATTLFGTTEGSTGYKEGQNAKFNVTVNGETMELERSTNSINLDGLTVNLKQEFGVESLTHTLTSANLVDATELSFAGNNGTVTLDISSYNGDIDEIATAINDDSNDISKYFTADSSSGKLVLTAKDSGMDTLLSVSHETTTTTSVTKAVDFEENNGYTISDLKTNDTISFQYDGKDYSFTLSGSNPADDFKNQLQALIDEDDNITADSIKFDNGQLTFGDLSKLGNNGVNLETTQDITTTSTTNFTAKKVEAKDGEAVTFESKVDSDKIVDTIKTMLEEYNAIISEIKSAYSTQPLTNSSGDAYEPLSDDDMSGMTESAISKYEEKAKTGLLFGDSTLSSLYQKLRFTFSGTDVNLLNKMGISTSYSSTDGSLSVTLDETKLRDMLESDPDSVEKVFTKENGIMQELKTTFNRYASTTGTKGLLVQQAGTPLSSLSMLDNTWQDQIDSLNEQIEKWQDKLSSKVDYYTNQFTRLEVLINQMNSQSSTLSGLTGG